MDPISLLLSLPAELEIWLILCYVAVVLTGARAAEALARLHFQRARRFAEEGFAYDPHADHYHCPEGEHLSLHLVDAENRLAIYRAPASRCNACPLKASCTPHEEGRHIYRPLAAWAETDIGRFHGRLSLLMMGVGTIFSVGGLARWLGKPGTGLLVLALAASVSCLVWEVRGAGCGMEPDIDQAK
ncbi:MAG TPA: hypothetical protein VFE62_00655 [Gemmataceae bacterium]|nr:hypothetical protein [Pirellulales bacterium]HZZ76992.1 hypothetical protein [Gemmataceae bacterium]